VSYKGKRGKAKDTKR